MNRAVAKIYKFVPIAMLCALFTVGCQSLMRHELHRPRHNEMYSAQIADGLHLSLTRSWNGEFSFGFARLSDLSAGVTNEVLTGILCPTVRLSVVTNNSIIAVVAADTFATNHIVFVNVGSRSIYGFGNATQQELNNLEERFRQK
jgi:branched-subunit amino acid transport protein